MNKLLLILSILLSSAIYSQNPNFSWASQIGSTSIDKGHTIKVDPNGNVYTAGYFSDTMDFNPDTGVYNLISNGSIDMFIQKLDVNGNFLWAISLGANNQDGIRELDFDLNGNLLVTGFFSDTVDFDPGTAVENLISLGQSDVFVLKLDVNGAFIWAKSFGGILRLIPNSIKVDNKGDLLITGHFVGKADFNPDPFTKYELLDAGSGDCFIEKLDNNGNFIWAKRIGKGSSDNGDCISVDSKGNIYTVGYFGGSNVDFDPGQKVVRLSSQGREDVFIQKLDPNGNLLWVRGIGGSIEDGGNSLTIDRADNVLITGFFNGTVDFNPDSINVNNLTSSGDRDIFIQKLDTSGNFLWAKSIGGTSDDEGHSIATDKYNNVYTSGFFKGTVNFNTDSLGVLNLASNGNEDIFIQKLDANGSFIWAETIGGTNDDRVLSISIDQNGSIYTTGHFETTVDFNIDSTLANNLTSKGFMDVFSLKLDQCGFTIDSLNASACNSYLSPSGKIWTQSGMYMDTIPNSAGCDSLLSIDLTVTNIDTSLTIVNHVKLTANDTLSSYQWIECTTGPIAGDTNRSFVASANGSYAVVLSNNGCVDTSACVSILTVGTDEISTPKTFVSFYPNPTKGEFTISVNEDLLAKTVQIYDVRGILIQEAQFTNKNTSIDLSGFGKGVYFLQIKEKGIRKKIVVY